jgi:hypothetical protein
MRTKALKRSAIWPVAAVLIGSIVLAGVSGIAFGATTSEGLVYLRAGHMGRYHWSAAAELPENQRERDAGEVCPEITMIEPTAAGGLEGQSAASCGPPPSSRPSTEYISGGYGGTVRSVLAVLFPPEVRKVKLKLRGHPRRLLRAGHVKVQDPDAAGPIPLAFVVQGLVGRVCIESIDGLDSAGEVVSTLGRQACV